MQTFRCLPPPEQVGQGPPHLDRARFGPDFYERFVALEAVDLLAHRLRRPRCFYIALLGVHPDFHGRGVGTALLRAVFAWADAAHCEVYLECAAQVRPFYERHGFGEVWRTQARAEGCGAVVEVSGMARKAA